MEAPAGSRVPVWACVLFSDGRRVTSPDGTVERRVRFTTPQGQLVDAASEQATGLIPLDPGLQQSRRSVFKTDVGLYLPELPPPGETQLVVEWPDEAVAETIIAVDTAALHAAAGRRWRSGRDSRRRTSPRRRARSCPWSSAARPSSWPRP
jgi:hypothetical protein